LPGEVSGVFKAITERMPMKPAMFHCKTLPLLADGALEAAVDAALKTIHTDLSERPTNEKARKLQLTLEFIPNALNSESSDLEDVRVGFKVKTSVPDLGPVQVQMVPKHNGLMFHPDVPEDPSQMSIMESIDNGTAN
jgi:hypothetical protein